MPKYMIEVEVPEGWEPVAYRAPNKGEFFLSNTNGEIFQCFIEYGDNERRIIVRRSWQWPSWLKAPYIAMDLNGKWYAYTDKPVMEEDRIWIPKGNDGNPMEIIPEIVDFTPPPCDDWKTSLRKNPNLKD